MTTIHDFFTSRGNFSDLIVADTGYVINILETYGWKNAIDYWLNNYPTKEDFLAGSNGNIPPYPDFYYQEQYAAPGDQAGFLTLGGKISSISLAPPSVTDICQGISSLVQGAFCGPTQVGPNTYYYGSFAQSYSNPPVDQNNNAWNSKSCSGTQTQGWYSVGTLDLGITITGDENYLMPGNGNYDFQATRGSGAAVVSWAITNEAYIKLEDCVDINGLANYLYGGPAPIVTVPAFGMQYPPTNPASTDILIPNHVSPSQKTPIHFQNYTQPLPPYIKK